MLSRIHLTPAARPELLPEETILAVQSAVGLYEGKYKIPNYQNGHAYLTSHRACYVDAEEPRKYAVAVELKDVDRVEPYAGFLKSSPKIALHLKPTSGGSSTPVPASPRAASTTPFIRPASPAIATGNWVCSVCSYSNPVPSNYVPGVTPADSIPPCLTCGIKPAPAVLEKAFLKRPTAVAATASTTPSSPIAVTSNGEDTELPCPRCTFHNHPSLLSCEICGEPLRASSLPAPPAAFPGSLDRSDSPAPLSSVKLFTDAVPVVKFSFRNGGDKAFLQALRSALIQQKWRLADAPPLPPPTLTHAPSPSPSPAAPPKPTFGIGSLEAKGLSQRQKNSLVLGSAFEDLDALMASAREVIAIAETLSSRLASNPSLADADAHRALHASTAALGLVSKDTAGSDEVYISELARQLADFLSDARAGLLAREGGVIPLVDLWAVFNRARGIDMVAPADLARACACFERLRLPVRLRRFRSGLLVVQEAGRTDEETVRRVLEWLEEGGRGASASEAAGRFGWSVGVAMEELEMAEERGFLCRDVAVEGVRFWPNVFMGITVATLAYGRDNRASRR